MSNRIGRFEIVSQLAQSPFATVYKVLDTENQQTAALKVVRLDQVQNRDALLTSVFEESDHAKPLNSHNIAVLYGVGDEDDQLLAAAEYVQGNSVATTLARKDGFSIWDLQDVARQVCQALDHARGHNVLHHSLEPAKIMVQWDGLVKVLGFGISTMNAVAAESSGLPEGLHYAAPEQLRDEACDHRAALFSLGAILYEMATEQKAFAGETAEQVRTAILEGAPPLPVRLKPNVNPGLSQLIMKALSKSRDERYQSGQELVRDLEQCKSSAVAAAGKQMRNVRAAGAAGAAGTGPRNSSVGSPTAPDSPDSSLPKMSASSAPVTERPAAKPSFAVDPLMAEDESSPAAATRRRFSEISELPPLKEVEIAPPSSSRADPTAPPEALPQVVLRKPAAEKAAMQVREAAQKAVTEIRKTPPKLLLYALAGAALLIALIIAGLSLSNYMQDHDTGGPSSTIATPAQPAPAKTAPHPTQEETAPPPQLTQPPTAEPPSAQSEAAAPSSEPPARPGRGRRAKSHAVLPAVAAQLSISSNPAGAEITFDGSALCTTPCTLTGIAAGAHVVAASKPGYGSASRTIALSSGMNSSLALELTQLGAKLSVASTPGGAVILLDGKDTGKLTPSQFTLDKFGTHTVVLRRYGYLEETSSVNTEAGQTTNVNLVLKPLGSTDEIRAAGGKFKKVFGGGGDTSAMGIVSIKTQPKGAQIMVNNRVLDRTSPFDFYLNPGTYVVDISISGYRPVHRVVNVDQRDKVAIEVTLSPE